MEKENHNEQTYLRILLFRHCQALELRHYSATTHIQSHASASNTSTLTGLSTSAQPPRTRRPLLFSPKHRHFIHTHTKPHVHTNSTSFPASPLPSDFSSSAILYDLYRTTCRVLRDGSSQNQVLSQSEKSNEAFTNFSCPWRLGVRAGVVGRSWPIWGCLSRTS